MKWAAIRRNAENFGWSGVMYDFFYRTMNRITFFKVLQGMTVTLATLDPQFLQANTQYRYLFLDEKQLREYSRDPKNQLSTPFLDQALAKGDYCYAVIDGERLASFGWYSRLPTHITDDLVLHFNNSYVYMYHGYTNDDYRGQRLHALGMAKALQEFSTKGFKGLISYVECNNYSSLKSVYRMGYKNFGRLTVVKMFGKYFVRPDRNCLAYEFNLKANQPTSRRSN